MVTLTLVLMCVLLVVSFFPRSSESPKLVVQISTVSVNIFLF